MINPRMGLAFTSTTLLVLLLVLGRSKGQMEEEEKLKGVTPPSKRCLCELQNLGAAFPWQEFQIVHSFSSNCTQTFSKQEFIEVDSLLASLYYRLQNLEKDVKDFEADFDTGLYSVISLRIIEIELTEISSLLLKLNQTSHNKKALLDNLTPQMQTMADKLEEIKQFDRMHVVKRQQESKRLKRSLKECEVKLEATPAPVTTPAPGNCPFGRLLNITGPNSFMVTQYSTSYPYGAWGMDPKPAPGKEDRHWLVILTSSNVFGNYIRMYNSHSDLVAAKQVEDITVTSSTTITNSIMGPGSVIYNNAYYYNCYSSSLVCRFDLTYKNISTMELPGAGSSNSFPYCQPSSCFLYTDIDLATDESGLWVIYTSKAKFGNVILSRLDANNLTLLQTWYTSLQKKIITNAFMACGVLYATRFIDSSYDEVFYSFDTTTGVERSNLAFPFKKMSTNIQHLNYNPRNRMLYVYNDAYILSYQAVFG
ncbi:olfactomedin-4-like [Huso huso]|uniref:Olfactomedin-4-like n=1 Tax=Huso huso TaxID=61971 RepID=A0ABR0YXX5_HUSHU